MTLHTTPLNAAHRAMDAKMVDFGGWDMPLHYGSQHAGIGAYLLMLVEL